MRTTALFATALAIAAMTCAAARPQRADSAIVGSIGDGHRLDARAVHVNPVPRAMHLARRYAIDGRRREAAADDGQIAARPITPR